MTTLRLIEQDETQPAPLTGREVLRLVVDLIDDHLPSIPIDDPDRGILATLALAAPKRGRR